MDKLEKFLNQHLNNSVETIIKESFTDVNTFVANVPQSDDITYLPLPLTDNKSENLIF